MDSGAPLWTARYALSPWWPVVLAVTLAVAVALWVRNGRSRRGAELGFIALAWGLVVAMTLTPIPRLAKVCVLVVSAQGWEHVASWPKERLLNIALFVPVGIAVWLARRWWLALTIAVAAPVVIEWLQGVVRSAGRDCDVNDVVANLLGLVIGLLLGAVLVPAWRAATRGDPDPVGLEES